MLLLLYEKYTTQSAAVHILFGGARLILPEESQEQLSGTIVTRYEEQRLGCFLTVSDCW